MIWLERQNHPKLLRDSSSGCHSFFEALESRTDPATRALIRCTYVAGSSTFVLKIVE